MSKLRRLIEAANRKCEMAWKVYSYNPEKDNELVDTSKAFDCIAAAQAHKREILEKNPNYTVEIVAESAQYKFKVGDRVLYEGDKATVIALRTTNTSPYYDVEKDKEKGKMQHPAYERELKPLQESANIDVKNPGVLEVPDGKKVDELPQSHFERLVDKKGYAEVIRALTNLEVWNKDKNKSLSSWASSMADKLKKKFRPESNEKEDKIKKAKKELDDLYYQLARAGAAGIKPPQSMFDRKNELIKFLKANESAQKNESKLSDIKELIDKVNKTIKSTLKRPQEHKPFSLKEKFVNGRKEFTLYRGDKEMLHFSISGNTILGDDVIGFLNSLTSPYTESAQKSESKVNMPKLKNEIQAAINKYFKDDKDLLEYVHIDTKKDKFGRDILEVRAELGYNDMVKLADHLDKIVTKYDRYAYFDQETSGIMTAVFESAQKDLASHLLQVLSKGGATLKQLQDFENKGYSNKDLSDTLKDLVQQKKIKTSFEGSTLRYTLIESAQINESRNYVIIAKVSVPDTMNNRDVEDKVEELFDRAGLTVIDVEATRK